MPPPAAVADAGLAAFSAPRGATRPPLAGAAAGGAPATGGGGGGVSLGARVALLQPTAAGMAAPERAVAGQSGAVAGPPVAPSPSPSHAGELVITELMVDPKTLTDNEGEWLELYNPGGQAFELRGCELDDGGKSPHALAHAIPIAPGAYATLARQAAPGFTPSAVVPLSLTNSQDSVALRCAGVEIDRVSYDARAGSPLASGASLALDPAFMTASQNDALGAWCAGTASYGPELGTPGRPNPPCHPEQPDAGMEGDPDTPPEPEE